jgi:hypothetical protein
MSGRDLTEIAGPERCVRGTEPLIRSAPYVESGVSIVPASVSSAVLILQLQIVVQTDHRLCPKAPAPLLWAGKLIFSGTTALTGR